MRLCIVGCILFLVGFIEASAKLKISNHGKTIETSNHCVEEDDNWSHRLPYHGGILNDKGEYIPGSIPEVWDLVLDKFATHMNPNIQKALHHLKQQYDQLNTHILKNDGCGLAQVFQKCVAIMAQVDQFQDREFVKACDLNHNNLDDTAMLDQSLCTDNGGNVTLLRTMNDYLQPLANRLYYVSTTYQPKSINKCQKKC